MQRSAGHGWGEEAAGDERAWLRGGWEWRSRCRSASLAARTAADGKWVRRIARAAADSVGATEWLEMCGEKKSLVMSELGCADAGGREMGSENCADGCGRQLHGRLQTGNGCGELRGRLRKAGATDWVQMGGEKKPLVMSELGCADGCGREMGAEKCADGCGRRPCNGVAGHGWGEEAAGYQRAWLRGRLRTANGCGELRGRLRTAWVPGSGWKWVGRRSYLRERKGKEGKGRERIARTAADGVAREWLAMGGEKQPLVMSVLGCADGCGRRGCKGVAGNGSGEEAMGMSELGCTDGCGMGGENCADGCGRRGCKGVAGNGWGEEAAGDERASLRGWLRTANRWGKLRGQERMAWVQGSGWKWVVGRKTRCSPRTRMLTRMLMDMQSVRTIFCNSLFEQSCIYIFPLLLVCSVGWTV